MARKRRTPDPLRPFNRKQLQRQANRISRRSIKPALGQVESDLASRLELLQTIGQVNASAAAERAAGVNQSFQALQTGSDAFNQGVANAIRAAGASSQFAGETGSALGDLTGFTGSQSQRALGGEAGTAAAFGAAQAEGQVGATDLLSLQAQQQAGQERERLLSGAQQSSTDVLLQLLQNEIQKASARASERALDLDEEQFEEAKVQNAFNREMARANLDLDRQQLDDARTEADRRYGLNLAELNQSQAQKVLDAIGAKKAAKRARRADRRKTTNELASDLSARAQDRANELFARTRKVKGEDDPVPDLPTYAEARNLLMSIVRGPLSRRGVNVTRINTIVSEALAQAGFFINDSHLRLTPEEVQAKINAAINKAIGGKGGGTTSSGGGNRFLGNG